MSYWVGHSKLKELDTIDFKKRKQMVKDMEAELTELSEINSKNENLEETEKAYVNGAILNYLKNTSISEKHEH